MKIPRPRIVRPDEPDCFGLRIPSILDGESELEHRSRVWAVERGVAAAFAAATAHLGADEARELFHRVARRRKRGKGKGLAIDRDKRLLAEYDAAAVKGESIPTLAQRLHGEHKGELSNTAQGIATQIRKLLRERQARERKAEIAARRAARDTILGNRGIQNKK